MATTIADVIQSARELSFDRFVTPTFYLGNKAYGQSLTITNDTLIIKTEGNTVLSITFSEFDTLEKVVGKLISEGYPIAYAAAYIGTEPSNSLLPISEKLLDISAPVYRKKFFSDNEVTEVAKRYLTVMMGYSYDTAYNTDIDEILGGDSFNSAQPHHMALWMAYWLVDKRRVYEMAAETMGQSNYAFAGMSGVGEGGVSINVNLADVFSVTDEPMQRFNEGERNWGVGADNVLGDASSFWYRLQLWIRSQFERLFGDFALRPDTVMVGVFDLQKDQNFYAFYDQYPYSISPLSREILSSFERGL